MKFYVASGIKNKDGVQGACDLIRNAGHEVLVDWAIEQQIPQKDREHHSVEVRATSVRDAEGIRNCDVFVLLSDPPEGRSMYVELGLAIATHDQLGNPQIFVVADVGDETIFHYHPSVKRAKSVEEMLKCCAKEEGGDVRQSQKGSAGGQLVSDGWRNILGDLEYIPKHFGYVRIARRVAVKQGSTNVQF